MKTSMREHFKKNAGRYLVGLIAALLVVAGLFVWCFWDWLRTVSGGYESGTATVRNLGLLVTAIIALPLAIWRSIVADRQAATARRQSETAARGLLNERYQKGAEMLGSAMLPVRLGGIYALARLAREHPAEYHMQIIQLLCAFVRMPPETDTSATTDGQQQDIRLREDIQAIIGAIGKRSEAQLSIEREGTEAPYILDLSGANLARAQLPAADLSRANLCGVNLAFANLFGAKLPGAVLSDAVLGHANLTGADLTHAILNRALLFNVRLSSADLTEAEMDNTDLTKANLSGCKGLTEAQLKCAADARAAGPPTLADTFDAKTGEPLVWHGKPT